MKGKNKMNTYRKLQYEIWNNHYIKFTYNEGYVREAGSVYRTGTAFASIPENMKHCPDFFARKRIDSLYKSAKYHKDFEERHLNKKA